MTRNPTTSGLGIGASLGLGFGIPKAVKEYKRKFVPKTIKRREYELEEVYQKRVTNS